MKKYFLTRQLDIIPLETLGLKILVIGAGAIGSWSVLALTKMGFSDITVYDDDKVSPENMNCQFYPISDIDKYKVDALQDMVKEFTDVEVSTVCGRWEGARMPYDVVIAAVDSMEVRAKIWEWAKKSPQVRYLIDPRMGAEEALLYTMNPHDKKDRESYEKTLYSDKDAVQERCTAKSTIYTANMLSGLVCKAVKDIVTESKYPRLAQWSIKDNAFQAWSKT